MTAQSLSRPIAGIDPGDREVLTAWCRAGTPRQARRAWIVLEEGAGIRERKLAAATPLSSARVQALVAGYRQHGLLGLVDAPRSGRPQAASAQALVDAMRPPTNPASISRKLNLASGADLHRDTVWRLAREQGVNIDRNLTRHVMWPAVAEGPWANVCGIAAGPKVTVVLAGPQRKDQRPIGTWLHPRLDALSTALALLPGSSLGWLVALEALRHSRCDPDKHRAVQERRGLLLGRATSQLRASPTIEVLVGGDPLSTDFMGWLSALRAVECALGKGGPRLRVRSATCFETWHHQLCEVLVGSSARNRAELASDSRATELLWLPKVHFWWHRGSP